MSQPTPPLSSENRKRCSWIMERPGSKGDYQCGLNISFGAEAGVPLCPAHRATFEETLAPTRPNWADQRVVAPNAQLSRERREHEELVDAQSRTIRSLQAHNRQLVSEAGRLSARLKQTSRVYLIKCGGQVKIGRSGNPRKRLEQIRSGQGCLMPPGLAAADSYLIHEMPGHVREESALHTRFQRYRTVGEWFRIEGELADYIQELGPRHVRAARSQ